MTVWKQGYSISENGWPMINSDLLDFMPIPQIGWKVGVQVGVPNTLLKALVVRLHSEVEPIDINQCGCFTVTNSMPNSNHNSGTAWDYNWLKHPFEKWNTWTNAQRKGIDKILDDFRGTIEFGGNWTDPRDEMHFELAFGPQNQTALQLANELYLDGLWGIFKPGPPPVTAPNPTTPPSTFAPLTIGTYGNTRVRTLQAGLNKVFPSYSRLDVDGDYGPLTAAVVKEFQRRVGGLLLDGAVGEKTAQALAKFGIKV